MLPAIVPTHNSMLIASRAIGMTSLSSATIRLGKPPWPIANFWKDVVKHKNVFFRESYTNYEACLSGGLRLIPGEVLQDALRIDYEKMIADGMFDGEPP